MSEKEPMEIQNNHSVPANHGRKEIFSFYDLDGAIVAKNNINGLTYRFQNQKWENFYFPLEVERELASPIEPSVARESHKEELDQLTQTIGSEESIGENKLRQQLFWLLHPDYLEREFAGLMKVYSHDEQAVINAALQFAKTKHEGQYRRHHAPYYTHPMHAALCAMEDGAKADDVVILLLHDTLEDTSTSTQELRDVFGVGIADKVSILSKKRDGVKISLKDYDDGIKNDPRVIRYKGYDRLSNITSLYFVPDWKKHDEYIQETEEKILPLVHAVDPHLATRILAALNYIKKHPAPMPEEMKTIADLKEEGTIKASLKVRDPGRS